MELNVFTMYFYSVQFKLALKMVCCRHIHTVELQLEVTRFLHRCESSSPSKTAVGATPSGNSAPPTLFGNSPMKVDVACKVNHENTLVSVFIDFHSYLTQLILF